MDRIIIYESQYEWYLWYKRRVKKLNLSELLEHASGNDCLFPSTKRLIRSMIRDLQQDRDPDITEEEALRQLEGCRSDIRTRLHQIQDYIDKARDNNSDQKINGLVVDLKEIRRYCDSLLLKLDDRYPTKDSAD